MSGLSSFRHTKQMLWWWMAVWSMRQVWSPTTWSLSWPSSMGQKMVRPSWGPRSLFWHSCCGGRQGLCRYYTCREQVAGALCTVEGCPQCWPVGAGSLALSGKLWTLSLLMGMLLGAAEWEGMCCLESTAHSVGLHQRDASLETHIPGQPLLLPSPLQVLENVGNECCEKGL